MFLKLFNQDVAIVGSGWPRRIANRGAKLSNSLSRGSRCGWAGAVGRVAKGFCGEEGKDACV